MEGRWEGLGGNWGEGYYSVGFFEKFIAGGEAGERVPVAVRVVFLEELVESRGYIHRRPNEGDPR